ncbi:hypothetical protein F5148DRAFT_1242865 [Russula earlei]|uniref:Uncharacterized protein n=1 Tax=Russula earlei TaxID=71964 RepID=A0ACC0TWP3_9AGAM|nr:hypothetical protein F5148DRAFT_1242865 [Russula earlei]
MRPLPIVALFCFTVGIAPSFALPSNIDLRKLFGKKDKKNVRPTYEKVGRWLEGLDEPKRSGEGAQPSGPAPRPALRHPNRKLTSIYHPTLDTVQEKEPDETAPDESRDREKKGLPLL